jgi:cytochrome c-type biogenesis protein
MVDSALAATVGLAFSAGVATFFAPCAYPLLPGYVGYYVSVAEEGESRDRPLVGAMARGIAAAIGMYAVFAVAGVITFTVGQSLLRHVELLEPAVGVFLVVLGGVTVAGRAPEWSMTLPERRSNVPGFAVFGAVYAVAATGCVAPIFLALVAQSLAFSAAGTAAVIFAYASGIALLMIAITVLIAVGFDATSGLVTKHVDTLTRVGGAIMILAGIGQLYYSIYILEVFG